MNDRTADGDPLEDRGTAETGLDHEKRADDLQGDDDFDQTNAQGEDLLKKRDGA